MNDKNNCIKKRTTSIKNKNIFVWIFIFVMLLFLIEGVSGATRYADLDAGTNGDGSQSSPWNSLNNIKSGVSEGDTVYVNGSESIIGIFYWDNGKNVTLQNWPGYVPVISVLYHDSVNDFGFDIQSGKVNIEGFFFNSSTGRAGTDYIILVNQANTIIRNCTIYNYAGTAIYINNANVTVEYSNLSTNNCTDREGHGIQTNAASSTIRYNTIDTVCGLSDPIFVREGGDNTSIYGNYVEGNSNKSDIIIVAGTQNKNITGVKVYNNYLAGQNTVSGIDIDASESNGTYIIADLKVYNNIFVNKHFGSQDDSYGVIRLNYPRANDSSKPIQIYNNIIANKGNYSRGEMFKAGLTLTGTIGYLIVKNNIFYVEDINASDYAYAIYENVNVNMNITDDYNYFYSVEGNHNGTSVYSFGSHTVKGTNPLFSNCCTNLVLQSSSPCINSGENLSSIFTTGISTSATWPNPLLTSRPQGSAWDIGAYESEGIYYVDYATGSDSNAGTSTVTPWKHAPGDDNAIGVADSINLSAGDTVVFKGNVTYYGRIDVDWNGSSSGYITYKSGHLLASQWGTDRAIVDGTGSILNTSLSITGLFSINAKSYIKIEGMKIQNVPFCSDDIGYCGTIAFIGNSGGNIIINNSVLYNGSDNGVMLQGLWNTGTNPSNFTIINSTISNMGDHGVQIRGGIDNVLIEGNSIHDCGQGVTLGNGIFAGAGGTAYCTGLTIRGNTIYNNPTKGYANIGGYNILVEDNYMYCNDSAPQAFGLLISAEFYQTGMHTQNVTIRNNIIEVNGTYEGAIRISNPTLDTGYIADVKIYNNYIIQRGQYYGIWLNRGISPDAQAVRNVTIKNNYIESLFGMKQVIYTSTNTTYGFNAQNNHYRWGSPQNYPFAWQGVETINFTYWNTTLGFDTFNHTQNTDPLLTNYYPTAGSPLIDTGLDLSATGFSDDKNGITRPQDGNENGSAEWDIGTYEYIDYPNSSLISPTNNTLTSNTSVTFNCSAVDLHLSNVTLYGNWGGGWHANETKNITGTSNSTTFTKTLSGGTYLWNCLAKDNYSRSDWGDNNYTLTIIDATAPNISLVTPSNGSTWSSSSTVTFTYNVTDNNDIANCSLIINGTRDQGNSSAVTKNISQIFTKSLSNANYNWSINCTDVANNQGNSSVYYLTVSYTAPSGGDTPSGGGGGGAATKPSNETISNATGEAGVNISITKVISTMTVENTTIIKDINALFGVKEIQITVNNEVKDVEVTIVRYYEKPSQVPITQSDNVYSYLQIYTKNLTSFEKGVITIQVEKDWISLENIARDDISLFQFNESSNSWKELNTTYLEEDDKYYYYQSEVKSFSYFYIGEKVLEREKIADRLKDVIAIIKNFFKETLIVLNNWLNKFIEMTKLYGDIVKPYQLYIFIGFGGIFVLIALIIIVRRAKHGKKIKREKIIKHKKNHVEREIKRNHINHKKAEKKIRKQIKKKNRRENREKRKVIKRQERIIKRRKKVVEREIKRHSKTTRRKTIKPRINMDKYKRNIEEKIRRQRIKEIKKFKK